MFGVGKYDLGVALFSRGALPIVHLREGKP